jgi:hypothetical protein
MRRSSNADPSICAMTQRTCTSMLSIGRAVLAGCLDEVLGAVEDIKTTAAVALSLIIHQLTVLTFREIVLYHTSRVSN